MIKVIEGVVAGYEIRKGLAVSVAFKGAENVESEFYPVKMLSSAGSVRAGKVAEK